MLKFVQCTAEMASYGGQRSVYGLTEEEIDELESDNDEFFGKSFEEQGILRRSYSKSH